MKRNKKNKQRKWQVDFQDLAYEGGGWQSWSQFYRTKLGARLSMIWNLYFASYGGKATLYKLSYGGLAIKEKVKS